MWLADAVGYQIFPDRFARSARSPSRRMPAADWAIEADWDDPVARDGSRAVRQLFRGDLAG